MLFLQLKMFSLFFSLATALYLVDLCWPVALLSLSLHSKFVDMRSSLLRDFPRGGTSATQGQKFPSTDDVKSVRNQES